MDLWAKDRARTAIALLLIGAGLLAFQGNPMSGLKMAFLALVIRGARW
ncbi:hypothetical protein HY641_01210 [Candidatus Woesearchaeota archaeon]|nr:hypothetical protein [Candidatus Woesearchaeota archaeon]